MAAFERSPGFKAACTNVEDGKIYSVGRAAERVPKMNSDVLFIYKPWLDSLNLDVPQTIEEFENALRAFKTQDPNGNGRADEVPFSFTMGNNQNDLHSLFGAFGRCDYSSSTTSGHFVAEEDGMLVFTANKEEYKNAVIWMHKMFQEGLFDQEGLISKDTKSLIALGNSEDVILGSFIGYDVANYVPADRIDDYIALAPLEGPNGDRIWSISGWTNGNISGNGFVITYTNPYPEASIRWLNEFFKQDNSVQIFLGPEGVCLEKNADGMYTYIPTPEGKSYNEFRFGNAPVHVPCIILSEDWNTVVEVMDEDVVKTKIMEIYKPYMTNTVPYFKFSSSEAEYLNSYGTEILEYVNSQLFTWLLNGGIESEWDSYCKKLEDMGVDELYDVVNTAYLRLQ